MTEMSRVNLVGIGVLMFATGAALAGVRIEAAGRTKAIEVEVQNEPSAPALPVDFKANENWRQFQGRVVSARDGKPYKSASVRLVRDWKTRGPVTTGADGVFSIDLRGPMLGDEDLIATSSDGLLQGAATLQEPLDSHVRPANIEIRLEPCRSVNALVADSKGTPVSGARVNVIAECGSIGSAHTDSKGLRNGPLSCRSERRPDHRALKSGVGFDYFENYRSWPPPGRIDVPETVSLVLDGAQTGRIKAVDSGGKAVAGAGFYVLSIRKKGKLSYAMVPTPGAVCTTDAKGIASIDWLPIDSEDSMQLELWPGTWHAPFRPTFPAGEIRGETIVRLVRKMILRGKVLRPDGTPAAGILVQAGGVGKDIADEYDHATARTAPDGTYAIAVAPAHSYMVGVRDSSWAALSLTNIVPRREGEVYELPDLRLIKGTIVQGQVTRGPDKQPVAGGWVGLHEDGDPLPSDFKPFAWEGLEWLSRNARTDRDGRYSFRVGPGEYRLSVNNRQPETLKVGSEETITRDHPLTEKDEPIERLIAGLVRESAMDGAKPVAGAMVLAASPSSGVQQNMARTNAAGKFEVSTRSDDLLFYARNQDGTRAGIAELPKGENSVIVILERAASVNGRVVDQNARPLANLRVQLSVQTLLKHKSIGKFHLETRTDNRGRYLLPGVVIGSGCELYVYHPAEPSEAIPGYTAISSFMVKGPEPNPQPDFVLPVSLKKVVKIDLSAKSESKAADPTPPTVPSGPSRSQIADLIRAIGRDPVSAEFVDRIATIYHPRYLWIRNFARMKQVATDPQAVQHLDALAREVQKKPLDTLALVDMAARYDAGCDDAMMKQLLRERMAVENWPSVTIRGTVIDEANQLPIPFPRVFYNNSMAVADEHGRFELRIKSQPVPSPAVLLWVEADGHASGELLVKKNGDLRIALRRDVPFFGKVVDHEGKPVEGAEVQARVPRALIVLGDTKPEDWGSSHGVFRVRTDSQGRFSFQGRAGQRFRGPSRNAGGGVAPDSCTKPRVGQPAWPFLIKAREVVGKTLIDATFMKRTKGKENANTFSTTIQAERAEFHFEPTRKLVHVKLKDVEIKNWDRPDDVVLIRAHAMEFPLPADPRFDAGQQPIDLEVTHPRFQTSKTVATPPTQTDKAPLIRLEPGVGISGQVFDGRNSKPVGDAMVQMRDDSGRRLATAFTDREAGMFRIPAILKPGRYTVVVHSAEFAPTWRTIVAGEVLSAHQFVLEPGGFITGKVVSHDGKPVAEAGVGWVQPIDEKRQPNRAFKLDLMTATDGNGTFRLGPLPPGEFQIAAVARSPRRNGQTIAKVNETTVITLSQGDKP